MTQLSAMRANAHTVLEIRTLGQMALTRPDAPLPRLPKKSQALLIYLAVTGSASTRAELAGLFWPEMAESAARTNLRQALVKLRQVLPNQVQITRHTVSFDPASSLWMDVTAFRALATQGLADPAHGRVQLAAATDLYAGDFLADFDVDLAENKYGDGFVLWVRVQRRHLRALAQQVLHRLVMDSVERRSIGPGLRYTDRLLALEPAHEEAHQQRMRLLAWDGRHDDALEQYERCRAELAAILNAEPLLETTKLAQRISAARDGLGRPTPQFIQDQIEDETPFLGRATQLETLQHWLHAPGSRLITITGPGGAGKTRLSLECMVQQRPLFLDGVAVVSLADVQGGERLATAVAAALGLNLLGSQAIISQICAHLRTREILLLLDNYEHLLRDTNAEDATTLVSCCLDVAPHLRILITSRERLNLAEEQVFEIDGLPYPPAAEEVELALKTTSDVRWPEAIAYPAVQLFVETAKQGHPRFSSNLPESERAAIVQICRAAQGLPLAIKLAASLTDGATYAERAERIAANLSQLAAANSALPARHQSVHATLAYSWRLLSPSEQLLLAELAVFQGGFDWTAAKAVVAATPEGLAALIDKSLLHLSRQGRYTMHNLVARFAAEQLARRSAGAEAVAQRHALHYLTTAQKLGTALDGSTMTNAVTALRAEEPNLRKAWRWAVTHLDSGAIALDALSQSRAALEEFHFITNQFVSGQRLMQAAVDALQAQVAAEAQLSTEMRRSGGEAWPLLARQLAAALTSLARLLMIQRRCTQAIRTAEAGLHWAQHTEDTVLVIRNHYCWGVSLAQQGRYGEAQKQIDAGVALAADARLPRLLVTGRHYQGNIAYHVGNYRVARQRIEEALAYFDELAPALPTQRSSILNNLGNVDLQLGNYDRAAKLYEQALTLRRTADGQQIGGTVTRYNLGRVRFYLHHYAEARAAYAEALDAYRLSENRQGESMVLGALGELHHQLGDYASAQDLYEQDLAILAAIEQRGRLGSAYALMSRLWCDRGDIAQATSYARRAVDAAQAQGQQNVLGTALTATGYAHRLGGAQAEALDAFQRAWCILRQLGQTRLALEPLSGLAELDLAQARPTSAQRRVDEIVQHLQSDTLDGILTPMRIYLISYRVLQRNEDVRAADVLADGYAQLQSHADRVDDDRLRHSLLTNVAVNRALIEAYERANQP